MQRVLRNIFILLVIVSGIFTPLVASGYSNMNKARLASSYIESADHYLIAAKRIPWRPDLYELSGNYFYHAEEYGQANSVYEKAFDRNALSEKGWAAWGDVNYLSGDKAKAVDIWMNGLGATHGSANIYPRLAQAYWDEGDYESSALYFQKYIDVQPEDASSHYQLGLLLILSDPDQAFVELSTASQLDPEFDPAVQTLRTALTLSSFSKTLADQKVVIGRGLGLVNEWGLAHILFQEAVQLDEENAEAWAWLGEANQQTGNDEELTYLDRALNLDSESSIVRGLRGLYFQRSGNHREALIEFQQAAKLDPQNPGWYVSIGEEYALLGNLILALDSYEYAANIDEQNAHYWYALADFCARNNINIADVGIPAAQKALFLSPNDPLGLDTLGWLLTLDGRFFEGEKFLLEALQNDNESASIRFHLGLLYIEKGELDRAHEHLLKAQELGSVDVETLLQKYFP